MLSMSKYDMVRYHQAEQKNKDMLQLLDKQLIGSTSAKAKTSPRLRMNHNFHSSLDDKVQRFINCMEPGTKVEIHHHPVDEMLIVIRGAIKAILVDDDKNVIDEKVIRPADGVYGVQLPKNVWHTIESLEPDTCVFEVKEGLFVSHEDGGILE